MKLKQLIKEFVKLQEVDDDGLDYTTDHTGLQEYTEPAYAELFERKKEEAIKSIFADGCYQHLNLPKKYIDRIFDSDKLTEKCNRIVVNYIEKL